MCDDGREARDPRSRRKHGELEPEEGGSAQASGIGEAEDGEDGALRGTSVLLHHIVNIIMARANGMIDRNEQRGSNGSKTRRSF
jgi:hypothetical protein